MGNCVSACLTVAILIALFACCCLPVMAIAFAFAQWG